MCAFSTPGSVSKFPVISDRLILSDSYSPLVELIAEVSPAIVRRFMFHLAGLGSEQPLKLCILGEVIRKGLSGVQIVLNSQEFCARVCRRYLFCYSNSRRRKLHIACGGFSFGKNHRRAHFAATPFPKKVTLRLCRSLVNAFATLRLATNLFRACKSSTPPTKKPKVSFCLSA